MRKLAASLLFLYVLIFNAAFAVEKTLQQRCFESLREFQTLKNNLSDTTLKKACQGASTVPSCVSVKGEPIFYVDRMSRAKNPRKVLVFSLIHGDEKPAGVVGRFWLERLVQIDPRNTWRVVPVLNPDGVKANTRTNANKVDLNRNFPTKDWDSFALKNWEKEKKSSRRYPGSAAASEPETRCATQLIEDFKPDFVVSIHTPLKVLDFDGPRMKTPKFDYLPWKSLGNYPGSMGRYLWVERKIPVLTAEFKESEPPLQPLLQLQDLVGFLASLEGP